MVSILHGPQCLSYWQHVAQQVHPCYEPAPDYLRSDIELPPSWHTSVNQIAKVFHELYNDTRPHARSFLLFVCRDLMPGIIGTSEEHYFTRALKLRQMKGMTALAATLALLCARKLHGHYPIFYDGPLMDPEGHIQQYIRDDVPQNSPIWYCLRPFFMGASGIADIFNMAYKAADAPDINQAELSLQQHLVLQVRAPFSAQTKCCMFNGHVQEELACEIYKALTKQRVKHCGTIISGDNCAYSHSPDGLVLNDSGAVVGLLEIKTSQIRFLPYTTCPPYYLTQCLQGIAVHKVQFCDFVSVRYDPSFRDGSVAKITVERLQVNAEVLNKMQETLNIYAQTLRERTAALPDEFYCLQSQALRLLQTGVTRSHPKLYIGNIVVHEGVNIPVDLNKILGPERREHWSKQPRLDPRNPPAYFLSP